MPTNSIINFQTPHFVVDPALAQRVPGGGLVAGEHGPAEVAFDRTDDLDHAGLGAAEE